MIAAIISIALWLFVGFVVVCYAGITTYGRPQGKDWFNAAICIVIWPLLLYIVWSEARQRRRF